MSGARARSCSWPIIAATLIHRCSRCALGRWIDWAAMVELFPAPSVGTLLGRDSRAFPVDRSRLDRRAAVTVRCGGCAGGGSSGFSRKAASARDENSVLAGGPLDAGACRLALAAGVPLLPAVILGQRKDVCGGWLAASASRV